MPQLRSGYSGLSLESKTTGMTQESLQRIKTIAKMVAKGKSRITCLDYIQDTWGLQESQAKKYYWATLKYLQMKNDDEEAELLRTKLITLLESQIEELNSRESVEARKAAQSAADLIAKLNSLYTDKREVKVQGDVKFEFGTPSVENDV